MYTLIKSYLGYTQALKDDDERRENLDIEFGPPPKGRTPRSPTDESFRGRVVPSRPLECDPECDHYDDFFEQFYVRPSRDGTSVLAYYTHLQSEVGGQAIYDTSAMTRDEPDDLARLPGTVEIYEHLFRDRNPHPRIVRYLGPAVSGYRLERLDHGPLGKLHDVPCATDSDASPALYQRWSLQILSGLSFLHSKGIIMNTISDDAFWLRADLSIALACFVNAASIDLNISAGLWRSASMVESQWAPGDMCLEPLYGEAEVGCPKRDIFDWAVLVYQWMTDQRSPLYNNSHAFGAEEVRAREIAASTGHFTAWLELECKMLGPVLLKAWRGEYETAGDVLDDARRSLLQSGRTLSRIRADEIDGFDWQRKFEFIQGIECHRSLRLRTAETQRLAPPYRPRLFTSRPRVHIEGRYLS